MARKSPARLALERELESSPMTLAEALLRVSPAVPSAAAIRKRERHLGGESRYRAEISQQIAIGQRRIARQAIDNAIRSGAVVIGEDGLLRMSAR